MHVVKGLFMPHNVIVPPVFPSILKYNHYLVKHLYV